MERGGLGEERMVVGGSLWGGGVEGGYVDWWRLEEGIGADIGGVERCDWWYCGACWGIEAEVKELELGERGGG